MLRVAHLLPNMITGGRERLVADLCAQGAACGIDPVIISYDPHAEGRRIETPGTPHFAVDRVQPGFAQTLHALIDREHIQVVHAQGHVSAALAWPLAAAVPIVTSLHVALGSGWRWVPQITRGLRASRSITAVSHDLANRFRPLAGRPITVIPPGIDLNRFRPAATARPDQPFTIGIAARLHPVKRHRDAIDALHLLAARGIACRLSIAGQGPLEAALRARARGLDIMFHGDVVDVPGWLSGLDAFLLCSDHEGTPVALLEALACGLPCLATAVGGVPAAVGASALLVPRRDPARLAAAIARLITGPAVRAGLAHAARHRAQRFSLSSMCLSHTLSYEKANAVLTTRR